jgi:hypothetical protein
MFCESELERLSICLHKLIPHVRQNDVAITGGVAIQLSLAEAGRVGGRTMIADLDLVASSLDAVAPSVSQTFLVSHYHVAQPGVPKFMVQLVDPVSRIRVDVFPDLVDSLTRARMVRIGAQNMKVLAIEDIFEHKAQTISKASTLDPVDPKHAEDAYALGNLIGRRIPHVEPECLAKDAYGIDAGVLCDRCQLSLNPHFPLARREEIFRLLGWGAPAGRGGGTTAAPGGGDLNRQQC